MRLSEAIAVALMPLMLSISGCNRSEDRVSDSKAADTLFVNGRVYTIDSDRSVAEAVAVKDGAIAYVGPRKGADAFLGPRTEVIDMKGGVLFPGFTDAHAHLGEGGQALRGLALNDALTPEALQAKVKAYADAHPGLPVISGSGWELSIFPAANPSKTLLDVVVSDRPVILTASDGHNSWVNSRALELAGITKATKDPLNGHIERDPKTGAPTGTLREAAQGLVAGLIPAAHPAEIEKQLEAGIAYENANGYTAVIDAAIAAGAREDAYVTLDQKGALNIRAMLSLSPGKEPLETNVTADRIASVVAALKTRRDAISRAGKGMVSGGSVKIFMDGVPENHSAALLMPYVDASVKPGARGALNMPEQVVKDYVAALDAAGFQVHFHAIGDRAVRVALDAVEQAAKVNGSKDRRHFLAHVELIDPADIPRFGRIGAYADIQSLWAFRDEYISKLTEPFIGPARSRWIYPFGSLHKAAATIVSGSDWPVSTSNPFWAMEVAVLRKNPEAGEGASWIPDEVMTVKDYIDALTINGARLMHQEKIRGSIEVGKRADLALVDQDPYAISPEKLSDVKIQMTVLEGKPVYRALEK